MTRKIIIAATTVILVSAIGLFAAEKAKENKAAEKPKQKQISQQPKQHKALLDELIAAYKADDKEKMGEIIKKMEARRNEMQKFAQFNKWHRQAHRRWEMKDWGTNRNWGQGCAMQNPGFNRGCPMAWNAGPMAAPRQKPRGCGMGQWEKPFGQNRQMPGCKQETMPEWKPDRAPSGKDLPSDTNSPEDLGW